MSSTLRFSVEIDGQPRFRDQICIMVIGLNLINLRIEKVVFVGYHSVSDTPGR